MLNKGKGLLAPNAPPIDVRHTDLFHTSCMIPAIDMHITLRRSTDSYLHIKYLFELYTAQPVAVPNSEMEDMKVASGDLFQCVDDRLAVDAVGWNCIYTDTTPPATELDIDNRKIEFHDPQVALLSGCHLKHQADGYILGGIANVLYTPICKTWEEFDHRELENQELSIPEEVFALEMQLNMMGFYYRLARYPRWSIYGVEPWLDTLSPMVLGICGSGQEPVQ
jgi:hypothetical protein